MDVLIPAVLLSKTKSATVMAGCGATASVIPVGASLTSATFTVTTSEWVKPAASGTCTVMS